MRTAALLAVAATLSGSAFSYGFRAAAPAPCTTATTACERWVPLGSGPARSLVYSTYSLDAPNRAITRALIMVHGADRNADHYFSTATAAGFLGGALGNKKNFPNLTKIVVTGHSAGGQFATRYEMSNKMHGTLHGVSITYVVANPSSYAWPAAVRPLPTGDGDPAMADKEALGDSGEKVHTQFTYGPFDSTKVDGYDRWPAGLEHRAGYTAQMSDDQLKKQLVERPTTYILGQVDVLPLGGFDSSPSGMAQGPTRRARGEAFFKYVNETLGAKHNAIIVPECGHNDRCMFTSEVVLPVIFPQ